MEPHGGKRAPPENSRGRGATPVVVDEGEAISVDGNNRLGIGVRVLVLIAVALPLWATSGLALADPSLPDPSAPVDAATGAASSAGDTATGAVDSATSAADDVVSAASNGAESASDSAVSTAAATAEAASGAAGSSSPASQAGGGSAGTPSSGAAGGSPDSGSSPPPDGSVETPAGESTSAEGGDRTKPVSRYDGGSARRKAKGDAEGPHAGRGAGAKQVSQESGGPTHGDNDEGREPVGDLSDLVESGQEIGDSTTVSVVTSPDRSDDPPLLEALPITGFEVTVLFAAGAGLASLGVALLSYARERSAGSDRPRVS
jgi:hypothetical protein